jgi:hypothetical protein
MFLVVTPFVGAAGDEQVWHLLLVHVAHDRRVGWGPQCVEQKSDLVFLDQAAHLFDCLWRAVLIVVGDEVYPAPGDAALVAHHLIEERHLQLAAGTVRGRRTAVRVGVAYLDLGRGDASGVGGRSSPRCSGEPGDGRRCQVHGLATRQLWR